MECCPGQGGQLSLLELPAQGSFEFLKKILYARSQKEAHAHFPAIQEALTPTPHYHFLYNEKVSAFLLLTFSFAIFSLSHMLKATRPWESPVAPTLQIKANINQGSTSSLIRAAFSWGIFLMPWEIEDSRSKILKQG